MKKSVLVVPVIGLFWVILLAVDPASAAAPGEITSPHPGVAIGSGPESYKWKSSPNYAMVLKVYRTDTMAIVCASPLQEHPNSSHDCDLPAIGVPPHGYIGQVTLFPGSYPAAPQYNPE